MENVSRYLWNVFFIWHRILPLFPSCVIILVYNWDGLGAKFVSLSVHRAICWNSEKIEPQNIDDRYCWTNKAYVQYRKKTCPFCQKAYMQRHCPKLLCQNPRKLHVFLHVQVLVLIAWGRYICMKKKTQEETSSIIVQRLSMNLDAPWNLYARTWRSFRY